MVGFNIAGSLLLFVMFYRQYKVLHAVFLSSVSITFIHYFVFKVCFSVPLPEKILKSVWFLGVVNGSLYGIVVGFLSGHDMA